MAGTSTFKTAVLTNSYHCCCDKFPWSDILLVVVASISPALVIGLIHRRIKFLPPIVKRWLLILSIIVSNVNTIHKLTMK